MIFVGDFAEYPYGGLCLDCSHIIALRNHLFDLRREAYMVLQKHFQQFPNRVYRYEWPEAYEWDCELYMECPDISLRTPEYVMALGTSGHILIEGVSLSGVYCEDGEIMVLANRGCFPMKDIVEIEEVLNIISSAKDYYKGLSKNGFYYKDEDRRH